MFQSSSTREYEIKQNSLFIQIYSLLRRPIV